MDKNIKKFIKNEKNIENIEIIKIIIEYDVYYTNEKYINKRDIEIFEKIDLEKIDSVFINEFKKHNFETKFKKEIENYLLKFFSK